MPPGTIVSTQAWSMHRNPNVFPSPDTFLPERWLETCANPPELFHMTQHMMPFGTGTRICGGQNFALAMMRITVAAVVRNFDIMAPPETTESSMDIRDSFVSLRAPIYCPLHFSVSICDPRSFSPLQWSVDSISFHVKSRSATRPSNFLLCFRASSPFHPLVHTRALHCRVYRHAPYCFPVLSFPLALFFSPSPASGLPFFVPADVRLARTSTCQTTKNVPYCGARFCPSFALVAFCMIIPLIVDDQPPGYSLSVFLEFVMNGFVK